MKKKLSKKHILIFVICLLLTATLIGGYFGITKLIKWFNNLAYNYEIQANSFYSEKNYQEAILNYQKTLAIQPKNDNVRFKLANTYFLNQNYKNAEEEYKKVQSSNPSFFEPYLNLGILYLEEKKYNQAEEILKKALNINQSDLIYSKLAQTYLFKKDYTKAQENFKKAEELNPQNQEASYFLGITLIALNDAESTNQLVKASLIESWQPPLFFIPKEELQNNIKIAKEKAQKIFQTKNEAYKNTLTSLLFIKIGFYDFALEYSQKALEKDEDYRDGWINQGLSYYFLENYNQALESFKKAQELDPVYGLTYFWLGKTYQKLNMEDLSSENLKKAEEFGSTP